MTIRVLWLSRHKPTKDQITELKSVFGETEIVAVFKRVGSGEQVVNLIKKHKCNEAVVVLPEYLLKEVVDAGFRPLRAIMTRKFHDNGNVKFVHSHFERVLSIDVVTERLIGGEL